MRPMVLVAALALSAGGIAWAEGGARSSRWEVNTQLLDKSDGCFYVVEGHAPGLPEGTSLHVNLTTAGIGPNTLRAAFFKVVVQANGDFNGSFHWPNKRFAPLVYNTKVELFVNSQPPGVRRTLMREFGYPANAREVIAEEEIPHGENDAERVAFSLAGLAEAEQLVKDCEQLRAASQVTFASTEEGWYDAWEAGEMSALVEFQNRLREFENQFVIRRESDLVIEIRNVTADVIEAGISAASDPNFQLEESMGRLASRLQGVLVEIESRRPLDTSAVDGPNKPKQKPAGGSETDE